MSLLNYDPEIFNTIENERVRQRSTLELIALENFVSDEVMEVMYKTGKDMPRTLREASLGGLAVTDTGRKVKERLFCKKS